MKFFQLNSFFGYYLLLAILLRLLIIPFFFHPDIKTYHFQAAFLSKGVFDIYSYLPTHRDELPIKEEFVYFPLTYFTLGAYQLLISPLLGGDFYQWLSNASVAASDQVGVFKYLFFLKLPYLILDCVIAWVLTFLFTEESTKRKVFLIWLFNPFSLIILYVFSNVDTFPIFFSILSLLFVKKNNYLLAGLMLGLGTGFKAYPLLFVPLLFFAASSWKDKLLVLLSSLLPFFLIVAPFLKSPGFQQAALNSGLTTRIIANGIPIGFGEMLFPTLILLAAIYFLAWQKKVNYSMLPVYYFIILLAIFATIHFHIQWLLWPMPFATIILVSRKDWLGRFILLMVLAILIAFLYDDSAMTVATLSVINPLFSNLPTPFKIAQKIYDPVTLQSILHSILFGLGLLTIFQLSKEREI